MSSNRISLQDVSITLVNGATFENIASQLQPYVGNGILIVKDGYDLEIHQDRSKFPLYIELEAKNGDIYYFRDKVTDSMYAVFGFEAATIICPPLNNHDNISTVASIEHNGDVVSVVTNKIEPAILNEKEVILD